MPDYVLMVLNMRAAPYFTMKYSRELKGIIHSEMKVLSSFTHPHVILNAFLSSVAQNKKCSLLFNVNEVQCCFECIDKKC